MQVKIILTALRGYTLIVSAMNGNLIFNVPIDYSTVILALDTILLNLLFCLYSSGVASPPSL